MKIQLLPLPYLVCVSFISSHLFVSIHSTNIDSNLTSDIPVVTEGDQSMSVIDRNTDSVPHSTQFDRIMEDGSREQSFDEESRDTVPITEIFSPTEKEAKKNRERFAITKSYSIEVNK